MTLSIYSRQWNISFFQFIGVKNIIAFCTSKVIIMILLFGFCQRLKAQELDIIEQDYEKALTIAKRKIN
ncbi:hypothetical protein H9X57_14475 [Flavobacterium piscinae]|uniref:hypothetical protein n=1 Tax=Flavobacterium piscinae TaxID=2506424 RepID=UPI0019C6D03F|nr:hypothetical protein [Flavobacterium piscinae]MBC8884119.1 hypothetical protein [Flavobacterium piscinae]